MLPVSNEYLGEIVSAELTENNGKVGAIVLVRPDGSPETARWYGSFSDTRISSGRNEGKMVGEMTAETLGSFGCTDFSTIGELKGMRVAFGIKHKPADDGSGKIWTEVNFIRPPRAAKPVTSSGLAGINRFKGVAIEAARGAPKPAPQQQRSQSGGGSYDDDFGPTDYGNAGSNDDDIPFAANVTCRQSEAWWRWLDI